MIDTPRPFAAQMRFLSTRELARVLGYRPQTLRKWRHHGRGPRFVRLGSGPAARVLYRLEDVETWLAEHTVERPHMQYD